MRQEDWIKDLQERMAAHQEPVKDDLWTGIEQAMGEQKVVGSSAVMASWRRYVAAAAVVMALLGGAGYVLFHEQQQTHTGVALLPTEPHRVRQAAADGQAVTAVAQDEKGGGLMAKARKVCLQGMGVQAAGQKRLAVARQHGTAEVPDGVDKDSGRTEKVESEHTAPAAIQRQMQDERMVAAQHGHGSRRPTQILEPAARQYDSHRNNQAKVSMNLYASNALGTYSGSNGLMMPVMMANDLIAAHAKSDRLFAATASPMVAQSHEETEHHQPLSLGLSAGYTLNGRWTLTSGVVYTRLVSDFTQVVGETRLDRRQTLHYVGVPLNINYGIWGNEKLKTYVTVGGQADFNVGAKTVKGGIEYDTPRDRVQLSAQTALGLQYNVTPQLGAYIEPGVKYSFHNNSETRNFFKDKPLNLHLQVGVRWNLHGVSSSAQERK